MSIHPWRGVTDATYRVGRVRPLSPEAWGFSRWWEMTLECGHPAERAVRYTAARTSGRKFGHRSERDVEPAPRKVRCELCPAGEP